MTLSTTATDALNKAGDAATDATPDKPYAEPGTMDLFDALDDGEMTKLFGRDDLQINTAKLRNLINTLQRRLLHAMLSGKQVDDADSFATMIITKQWSYKSGKNLPRLGDSLKSLLDTLSKVAA